MKQFKQRIWSIKLWISGHENIFLNLQKCHHEYVDDVKETYFLDPSYLFPSFTISNYTHIVKFIVHLD